MTIKQLQEPYKSMALRYLPENMTEEVNLANAFNWGYTDEGDYFWKDVYYGKDPLKKTNQAPKRAKRYNKGKIRYDLIPHRPLREQAKVYTNGAHKYTTYRDKDGNLHEGKTVTIEQAADMEIVDSGENNWKLGQPWKEVMASVKRHIAAWETGEDVDEEIGTLHLANAIFGLNSIIEFMETHPELDNRDHWWKKPFKKLYTDIDGVLCQFEEHFLKYFEMDETHPHDWCDPRFVDKLESLKTNEDFWKTAPRLIDPSKIDYPIAGYCTARSIPEEWIQDWLNVNGFPCAPILRVNFGESKVDKLKAVGCEVFIDDSINNFVELNSNGVVCYLADRPHNRKYDVGYMRVKDIVDLSKKLKNA